MARAISLEPLHAFFANNLNTMHRVHFINVAYAVGGLYAVLKIVQVTRRRLKTTALRGPPSPSLLWGTSKMLATLPDIGEQVEEWAEEYGGVYEIPTVLGARIVLCDPKAVTHLFGGEPWSYILTPFGKFVTEKIVSEISVQGAGILIKVA